MAESGGAVPAASRSRTERCCIQICAPDVLGGVASLVEGLARSKPASAPALELCWLRVAGTLYSARTASPGPVPWREVFVQHDRRHENLFAVLRRMRRALGAGPGVLVANNYLGLAYAARYATGKAVVQILHGDAELHYGLAERFEAHVDAFVCVSARIHEELCRRLPKRSRDIHHLPSGVPIPERARVASPGPLRLVYCGRLEREKGVLDLPEIDRRLTATGVEVYWPIIGSGPEEAALREAFDERSRREGFDEQPRVHFTGGLSGDEARALLPDHDVFVLPSRLEGLPLSLLEAMAAGLVPVVSDLPSGVREVVEPEANGLLVPPEKPEDFAAGIRRLDADRALLERCSRSAADRIRARHALHDSAAAYFELFAGLVDSPPHTRACTRLRRGPSRLDRPWLPSVVVRAIRRLQR